MNPLTANPAIALDYARQVNAERIRQAEEHRRYVELGQVLRRPRRLRREKGLAMPRPRERWFTVTT